ncbi:Retrovirus-related Pol polyprotein from transposon 412, partial [Stegodyphus mimosarum]
KLASAQPVNVISQNTEHINNTTIETGYKVSKGIFQPDDKNLKVIQGLVAPKNKKGFRRFLGLIGLYRRFIPNFAQKALPLTQLSKDKVPFYWSQEAQEAFDILKSELLNEPILTLSNFNNPFSLCTDASNYALSAVLCQEDSNGFQHRICYASRKLKGPETRYSTVEREILAVVWATPHFRQYLLGKTFTVYSNQASLSHVLKLKNPTSRIARWIMGLSQFDYKIVH